jgi:hypothetical protein
MLGATGGRLSTSEVDMSNQYDSGERGLKDEAALLGVFFVAAAVFIAVVLIVLLH